MDTRKRKRVLRPLLSFVSRPHFFVRSLVICFCFILCYVLLSQDFRIGSSRFRPARIVRKIPVFSSSISNSVQDLTSHHVSASINNGSVSSTRSMNGGLVLGLRIQDRVLFSDHVLVILSTNGIHPRSPQLVERIDCIYHRWWNESSGGKSGKLNKETVAYPMLSADEYRNGQWIVRCPSPPANYSAAVGLKGERSDVAGFDWVVESGKNQTVQLWDMVAYEAAMDGEDIAVVFAKGLNLRADRVSDPDFFSCHFKVGNSGKKGNDTVLTSTAITAAQEVIRCPLPLDLKANLGKKGGVQITVEKIVNFNRRSRSRTLHQLVPSIARLYPTKKNKVNYKYKLCACSMVWNQAAFIREWIKYHAWLGVQRWFIYDNNSDDGLKEVIDELDSENYNVSRHVWPWVKSQEAGFAHCVLRAREQCTWIGFFDVDEFYYLQPPKHGQRDSDLRRPGPDSLRALVENISSSLPSVAAGLGALRDISPLYDLMVSMTHC